MKCHTNSDLDIQEHPRKRQRINDSISNDVGKEQSMDAVEKKENWSCIHFKQWRQKQNQKDIKKRIIAMEKETRRQMRSLYT